MAEINWNDIYKNYLTETGDPFKAAEYTVFGRLTGSKKVPKVYSQEEWYKVNAPDYYAISTYNGTDELNKYTKGALAKSGIKFTDLRTIAQDAFDKDLLGGGYGTTEYYTDLIEIWKQKNSAEKSFTTQPGSRWWKDYGLPDPAMRFNKDTNKYDAAEKYIADQTAAYAKKLGADPNANARAADFNKAIRESVYQKLDKSGVTPFLVASQKRVKARG